MVPLAVKQSDIRDIDLRLFEMVKHFVGTLPEGVTCHDVCRETAKIYPSLIPVRGCFGAKGVDHSWLRVRDTKVIIDAYPVAGGTPFIVTLEGILNPWRRIYIAGGGTSPR